MSRDESLERVSAFVDVAVRIISSAMVLRLQLDEATAQEIARDATHDICSEYSSQYMYVPRDLPFALSKRDMEIYEMYTGRNMHQVTAKYRISHVRVQQIVKRVHAEQIAARQQRIF